MWAAIQSPSIASNHFNVSVYMQDGEWHCNRTFAEVIDAIVADKGVEIAVGLPNSIISIRTRELALDNYSTPTGLYASVVFDFANDNEASASTLYQILLTASGVTAKVVPLTATS